MIEQFEKEVESGHRGDVVQVQLSPVIGSEQAGTRPALVISPDVINEHSPVVLIAPMTSKKTERVYPFEANYFTNISAKPLSKPVTGYSAGAEPVLD